MFQFFANLKQWIIMKIIDKYFSLEKVIKQSFTICRGCNCYYIETSEVGKS